MFEEWAKSAGWSGGLGGNPSDSLWFCGIEPGGNWLDLSEKNPLAELVHISEKQKINLDNNTLSARASQNSIDNPIYSSRQFVQKIAKISLVYQSLDIRSYKDYVENKIFTPLGKEFHANLYPLPFSRESDEYWTKLHTKQTGLFSKAAYRAWCRQYRLPQFRELAKKFRPKCILCFGYEYADDFIFSFSYNPRKTIERSTWKIKSSKKTMHVRHIETDAATILICPFLGQGGVMSDQGLIEIGNCLRDIAI
jgi:hypothetical protein